MNKCAISKEVWRLQCSTNINIELLLDIFTLKKLKSVYFRYDGVKLGLTLKATECDRPSNASHFMGSPVLD